MTASTLKTLQTVLFPAAFAIGWWLEGTFPARSWPAPRLRHAGRNLVLWLFFLAVNTPLAGAVAAWASFVHERRMGLFHCLPLSTVVRVFLGIVVLDLTMYAGHFAKHRVAFLWRLHRVHHSDPALDTTSTYRFHPGDVALTSVPLAFSVGLFGVPPLAMGLYFTYLVAVEAFLHANLALPEALDRIVRTLVATPGVHFMHHVPRKNVPSTSVSANYSEVLTLWDRLFGTYSAPSPALALSSGLPGFDGDEFQSVSGMLKTPLER
jgi:sterol desaturase/sphingolipid hydroxylase (fatty acid hydroxylase superfamily)